MIAAAQVFDDFCRDFDRVPVAWHVDPGPAPVARARAEAIGRWLDGHRHVRLTTPPVDVPPLWFPAVALRIGFEGPGAPRAPSVLSVGIAADDPTDVAVLCDGLAARARASQIEALRRAIDEPAPAAVALSAVIATRRRPAALALVLDSLARQTCDPALFEIVVVNNDPADTATVAVVDDLRRTRFADRPDRLRLVACPFPGLSFARNAGIASAHGAVVAFLDDDAEAAPDWAGAMHAAFAERPDAGIVGGRVRLALPSPRPRWVKPGWERYWSECAMHTQAPVVARHWWDYPYGANWGARRAALLAIGGFRTQFGRMGADAAGGEEIAAAALVERLGHIVVVDPRVEVVHRPDPARFTFGHVWRRIHAGKREEYAQERLGYLPPALGLGATAWSVVRRLKNAILARGLAPHQRLEELMYASAEARILPALVRDRRAASSG